MKLCFVFSTKDNGTQERKLKSYVVNEMHSYDQNNETDPRRINMNMF